MATSPSVPVCHVDAVDAPAVGGVGEAEAQLARVLLGLAHALGERSIPGLGLDHGQLGVVMLEDVVGLERLAAPPLPFEPAEGDLILPADAAALGHAPPRGLERGVDVLGSGLGLVHAASDPSWPVKAWWRRDCFRASRAASLRW